MQDLCRRPEEFWNATMAHLSGVGEAIRKTHYPELLEKSAHAFCWICSFVRRLNDMVDPMFSLDASLSDIVGFKYPKVCGHCFEPRCECLSIEREKSIKKTFNYEKLLQEYSAIKSELVAYDLQSWQEHFLKIYSNNIHLQTMESIGFHLLEEAGETAKAIRLLIQFRGIKNKKLQGIDDKFFKSTNSLNNLVGQYYSSLNELKNAFGKSNFEDELSKSSNKNPIVLKTKYIKAKLDLVCEIADTFSWFCNVLLKLNEITHNLCDGCENYNSWNLEDILIRVYKADDISRPIVCYACKRSKCKCTFFHETRN